MTTLHCPLPDVEAALSPYIHSRQETLRIRQILTSFLLSNASSPDVPLTQLALSNPPPNLEVRRIPVELSGVRRDYLQALRANLAARRRLDDLSHDVDALQRSAPLHGAGPAGPETSDADDTFIQAHITLRRLRRLHRQLGVVDSTLQQAEAEGRGATEMSVADEVERKLGPAPQPPLAAVPGDSPDAPDARVMELTDRLKRQVLEAKGAMERARAQHAEVVEMRQAGRDGAEQPGLPAQVVALRAARDTLVHWMEEELGKISEDGETSMSSVSAAIVEGRSDDEHDDAAKDSGRGREPPTEDDFKRVHALYDEYVAARTALVATMDDVSSTDPVPLTTSGIDAVSRGNRLQKSTQQHSPPPLPPSALLPHVVPLLRLSRSERALMQQSSYLRQHLGSATAATRRTVSRLAGESHLVPPGASRVEDWADAADVAGGRTEEVVQAWLRDGTEDVRRVNEVLDELGAGRAAWGELSGDV